MDLVDCSIAFEKCYKIFSEKARPHGEAIVCEINKVLKKQGHNCVGCNLSDRTEKIDRFLQRHQDLIDSQHDVETYMMELYLFVERMEMLIGIMGVPDVYVKKRFPILGRIKRCANFIKHPDAFVLTHHPKYTMDGFDRPADSKIIIDEVFIGKYYSNSNPERKKELAKMLLNKSKVLVVWPDIVDYTDQLCDAFVGFTNLVLNNEVYRDILEDKATIVAYFENGPDRSMADSTHKRNREVIGLIAQRW